MIKYLKQVLDDIDFKKLLLGNCFGYVEIAKDHNAKDFILIDDWKVVDNIIQYVQTQGIKIGSKEINIKENIEFEDIIETLTGLRDNYGFFDDYQFCHRCFRIIEIRSANIKAKDYFESTDNGLICGNCVRENDELKDEYINQYLINNHKKANTILPENNLKEMGFVKLSNVTKLFKHQKNSPECILSLLNNVYDVIFNIDTIDIVSTHWDTWVREKET